MHWFDYAWIVPIVIGVLVWAYFSFRDIYMTIHDYIDEKETGYKYSMLTYMDDWLEDYTKSFVVVILLVIFSASFICFLANHVFVE